MDNPNSKSLLIESLQIQQPTQSVLELSGSLHSPSAQKDFDRFLDETHRAIVAAKLETFTIDVRGLSLVSSSAIRLFVTWISRAEAARYRLVFWVDRTITWHRLSFSVLQSLAPGTVDVVDRSARAADSTPP